MNSYAKYIETVIEQEPENKLLEASILYQKSFGTVPEMTYYKTLERMSKQGSLVHLTKGLYYRPKKSRFGTIPISEKEIIGHYTNNGRGIVIGYRLYNQKGLTTQISKRVEVLSSAVTEQKKNIQNVCVTNSGIDLTQETIPLIETMEILQNYKSIEDISDRPNGRNRHIWSDKYSEDIEISVDHDHLHVAVKKIFHTPFTVIVPAKDSCESKEHKADHKNKCRYH